MDELDAARLATFEQALRELIERHGAAPGAVLSQRVSEAVAQLPAALRETAQDGRSLGALDVVRIRAGKLAARSLPADLYRDTARLAALRAEIHMLALALVGPAGALGSRF